MKNLNISYFKRKITKTFFRFPVVVLFILLATISSLIDFYSKENNDLWVHLFLTSICAIPLFTSINLYLERVETRRWFNISVNITGFLILIVFFLNLPHNYIYDKHFIRSSVLFLAFVISMFYLPFIGFHQPLPFWFYNYNFVKRIIISFIYVTTLFVGLLLALFAILGLFDINTSYLITPTSIVVYVLLFPLLVIGGLSPKFTYHAEKVYYPRFLKVFAQFILMPIGILYAIILIAYIVKVIATGIWPSGYTVSLVLGYSIIVLLNIILTHPILFEKENQNYRKIIYGLLALSYVFIVVYLIAIFKRINEYGLTEGRLYVVLYAFWFFFVVTYFLFKKMNDLRVIPLTLLLILFLSVTGPWNVFKFSKNNQLKRLINIAKTENIWIDNKIDGRNAIVKESSLVEMSSIAMYLVSTHGHRSIEKVFNINADSLFSVNNQNSYDFLKAAFKSAGMQFNLYPNGDEVSEKYYQLYRTHSDNYLYLSETSKFVCLFKIHPKDSQFLQSSYKIDGNELFRLDYRPNDVAIYIYYHDSIDATLWLAPYYDYLKELNKDNADYIWCKPTDLKAIAQGKRYNYVFYFNSIGFEISKGTNIVKPTSFEGLMFIEPIKR